MKKAYQSSCEINLHHAFSCQPNTKENYSLFGSQSGTSSRPPERLSFLDSFLCSTLDQSLFVTILRNPYQPSVYAKWVLANSETNHYIEPCELSSITSKPFCFRFFGRFCSFGRFGYTFSLCSGTSIILISENLKQSYCDPRQWEGVSRSCCNDQEINPP